jgi:hypothetical protein
MVAMTIQHKEDEIIIKIPTSVGMEEIQRVLDYLGYKIAVSNSKANQAEVDKLATEVNAGWWERNKAKFLEQ